jgi:hypothetical protein
MQGTLGDDVVATLIAPGVLPASTMGARIEVPYTRAIVAHWRPAAYDPVTGLWTVVCESPVGLGEYQLVWRTSDPEPPEMEVFIPLAIVSATGVTVTPGELPEWAPDVDEVARVTPAYSRGGFDDDSEDAGAEQLTFTDDTSPTRQHVEGLIQTAADEVQGRVAVAIPSRHHGLAKTAVLWHVAASISGGKRPADTDDATGEYRANILNFRNTLDELIKLARTSRTRLA